MTARKSFVFSSCLGTLNGHLIFTLFLLRIVDDYENR